MPTKTEKGQPCGLCDTRAKGKRRRCSGCKTLVHACCWDTWKAICTKCYGKPSDREGHLERIRVAVATLDAAIDTYNLARAGMWDEGYLGGYWVEKDAKPPQVALDDLVRAICEAAEDLGIPEETVQFPVLEMHDDVEMPEYDVEVLFSGLSDLKVLEGGDGEED